MFSARIEWDRNWQQVVANATADDAKVKAACAARAKAIAVTARQNVKTVPGGNRGVKQLAKRCAQFISTKPVLEFRRRISPKNTRIPVALVISDYSKSQNFEYGTGRSFPATWFMAKAGRANRKGDAWYGVKRK